MIDQPKLITGPDGQALREQTLAEYCMALPEGHLARRELVELQRRNQEMLRLARQVETLEAQLAELQADKSMDKLLDSVRSPEPQEPAPEPAYVAGKKTPCKFCGKQIAIGKGYWRRHLQVAHPEQDKTLPQI